MGAWGVGIFENDDALDWVFDLEKSRGEVYLARTFLELGDSADSGLAANALAAAAVVAAMGGRRVGELTDEIEDWLAENRQRPSPGIVQSAITAVKKAMAEDSELMSSWAEAEDGEAFIAVCNELISALEAI